ncbi:hypothetical protein F6Y02_14645 [Bacillus megaterium]|nr:hypothetical protein [Priestia megaterium]
MFFKAGKMLTARNIKANKITKNNLPHGQLQNIVLGYKTIETYSFPEKRR